MFKKSFIFGAYRELPSEEPAGPGSIPVNAGTFFTGGSEHGFLRQDLITGAGPGMESLMSGGFLPRAAGCDMHFEEKANDAEQGVVLDLQGYPLRFKVMVPEKGVYRVTLKIAGRGREIRSLFIYTMRRNLIAHNISIAPDETRIFSFLVHVCGYMPAASNSVSDERAVYVSLIGQPAVVSELTIEKTEAPTIFVAGDSTVTDQPAHYPYYPKENYGGWAQNLPAFLNGKIAVCNQAHSGLTATCFREDGHWNQIESRMKDGDLFLIQFGHNDQKRRSLRADGGYSDNLRWYVNEVRKRGAYPIIVTPLSRSARNSKGELNDVLVEYAKACMNVGREMNVPVIDLHGKSVDFINKVGKKETLRYYVAGDVTHTNDFGCMKMALLAAEAAEEANVGPLLQYFSGSRPSDFIGFYSEQTPETSPNAPAASKLVLPFVDIAESPELDWIQKAGEKGLLDICVLHLHPLEGLPRAQFMFLLFKALRMAPQSFNASRFQDVKLTDWETDQIHTAAEERLIEAECLEKELFRPDDFITGKEAAAMAVRSLHPREERGLSADQCIAEASHLGLVYPDFPFESFLSRGKVYRLLVSMMELSSNSDKTMPSSIEVHPVG